MNFLKRKKQPSKVIIVTGAIGVGKTTFIDLFEIFLKEKSFKVYRNEEAALQLPEELKIYYKDPNRYSLFFQNIILGQRFTSIISLSPNLTIELSNSNDLILFFFNLFISL